MLVVGSFATPGAIKTMSRDEKHEIISQETCISVHFRSSERRLSS